MLSDKALARHSSRCNTCDWARPGQSATRHRARLQRARHVQRAPPPRHGWRGRDGGGGGGGGCFLVHVHRTPVTPSSGRCTLPPCYPGHALSVIVRRVSFLSSGSRPACRSHASMHVHSLAAASPKRAAVCANAGPNICTRRAASCGPSRCHGAHGDIA